MLNLPTDVDLNKLHNPISFDHNRCPNCGEKKSLTIIDQTGRPVKQEINPFTYLLCTKCGSKFSINWSRKEDGSMHITAGSLDIEREFAHITNQIN